MWDYHAVQQDVHSNHGSLRKQIDLIVLKYMLRRLHLTLGLLKPAPTSVAPLLYTLQERHGRKHRIVIYKYSDLLYRSSFQFVGFVSKQRAQVKQSIVDEMENVDQLLLKELAYNPGLLSYSSLELREGHWYNLVIMSDSATKEHVKSSSIHRHAAYELASDYYDWIRLHNGILAEGLDHTEMCLQKTRHYSFSALQTQPVIKQYVHEPCHSAPSTDGVLV
ncbi:hypothetical protein EPA93_44195 [Ktedonosporobacter rubrisoli]|uniref:Uncharacterized protein n=1 Tax=Ktedonosporobacter rubrisoli TaxID=2509675 RepID=A0A4P6K2Y4_KTERU|nr:hypothetical protein [Ktedonosporobacter rubrisoli]QBD82598.1 hypothetical protein EPA93_44195 [Ktedonosporobacter rubrisoli]